MVLEKIVSKDSTIKIETKAGILSIDLFFKNNKIERVMMEQAKPRLKDISIDILKLTKSLNLKKEDIDFSLPSQLTSSGLFTLPICVRSYNILKSIKPKFDLVSRLCKKYNAGSFFVYTFDTIEKESKYHARCFCPLYGVNEDPTTGTANCALSYYLIKNGIIKDKKFTAEQGDIIGRPGRVIVEFKDDKVRVGGKAKIVKKLKIDI